MMRPMNGKSPTATKMNENASELNRKISESLESMMRDAQIINPNESLRHVVTVAIIPSQEVEGTLTVWNAGLTAEHKVDISAHWCEKIIEKGMSKQQLILELMLRINRTDQSDKTE
jgi:hypothetical protein